MSFNLKNHPFFSELRKKDERLTFGQYLTVLKEWVESFEKQETIRLNEAEVELEGKAQRIMALEDKDETTKEKQALINSSYWLNGYIQAKKEILTE